MTQAARTTRPGVLITLVALAGTAVALQQTLVVPILPDFPRILSITPSEASWLVTITMLTGGISVPIITRMADMYGKRRMILVSLGFMVVGSLVATIGTSLLFPLIGRALQGVAMSLIPIAISVLKEKLPEDRLGPAIALTSATMAVGGSIGLPLSGLIYDVLGWSAVFFVTAIAGVLLMISMRVVLDESPRRDGGRFDVLGAVILSVTLTAALLIMSNVANWGWTSSIVITMAAIGLIALGVWVPLQLRHPRPLVDLRVAWKPTVLLTNIYAVCAAFAMMANVLMITQQLRIPTSTGVGFGLTSFAAGLCMLPSGVLIAVLSPFVGRLIQRLSPQIALVIGSGSMAIGYTSLLLWHSTIPLLIVGSLVIGIGTSFALSAQPLIVMRAAPPGGIAAANGLNALLRSMGTAASSAASAGILAATLVETGGILHPTVGGFATVNIVAIVLAVIATGVALALPRQRRLVEMP